MSPLQNIYHCGYENKLLYYDIASDKAKNLKHRANRKA